MRKSPIVSPGSVEDMESSVLPMRGIKEGKRELGKILFLLPLIQPQSSAHFPAHFFHHLHCFSCKARRFGGVSCCSPFSLRLGCETIRSLAI